MTPFMDDDCADDSGRDKAEAKAAMAALNHLAELRQKFLHDYFAAEYEPDMPAAIDALLIATRNATVANYQAMEDRILALEAQDKDWQNTFATHMVYLDKLVVEATCAFCIPANGEKADVASRRENMREHMMECDKHPMSKLVIESEDMASRIRELRHEADGYRWCSECRAANRHEVVDGKLVLCPTCQGDGSVAGEVRVLRNQVDVLRHQKEWAFKTLNHIVATSGGERDLEAWLKHNPPPLEHVTIRCVVTKEQP